MEEKKQVNFDQQDKIKLLKIFDTSTLKSDRIRGVKKSVRKRQNGRQETRPDIVGFPRSKFEHIRVTLLTFEKLAHSFTTKTWK